VVAAAERHPLLVVIDDMHWLDASSAAVVNFVARRLCADAVGLVLTRRTGEPGPLQTLGQRHELRPLRPSDVVMLVATLRAELPALAAPVAAAICERSRGNPLAIEELTPLLDADHCTGARPLTDPIPLGERGRRTFGASVARLPRRTRTALAIVAAAGSQVALVQPTLARFELSIADLDPAIAARVMADTSDPRFTHPLRRAAAYEAVAPARRRAIHRCLAELNAGTETERYAHHLDRAGEAPDVVARAFEAAAVTIARRAGRGFAAATWARSAELTRPGPDWRRRAVRAADGYLTGGQVLASQRWLDALRRNVPAVEPTSDSDREVVAEALLLRCSAAMWHAPSASVLIDLTAVAERLAVLDPRRATRAFGTLAAAYENAGDLPTAESLTARAVALSECCEPTRVGRIAACWHAHITTLAHGAAAARPVREIIALDDVAALVSADPADVWFLAQTAQWQEDFDYARTVSQLGVAELRSAGVLSWLPYTLAVQSDILWWMGEWPAARAIVAEAVTLAEETGQRGLLGYALANAGLVAAGLGDHERSLDCLARAEAVGAAVDFPAVRLYTERAYGLLCLGTDRPADAVPHLQRADEVARVAGMGQPTVVAYRADYVEALARCGQVAAARTALSELGAAATQSGSGWAAATALRCQAMLDPEAAECEGLLRSSIERLSDELPIPFERHRSELHLGVCLRRRRRLVDARAVLRSAAEGFRRLGAGDWTRRADAELTAAGDRVRYDAREPDAGKLRQLSAQQLQVVLGVAAGGTNREVAASLFISPKTVDYHLRNACAVLGVRNRTELASLVASVSR
jgi:DNA-binding CsgD family transcriptional regulator